MPQTHKIVNGKLVLVGAQRSSDLVPRAQPPAQRPARPPQPKPQPKPWWAQLANHVMYELRGRPATAPFPQPPVTVTPPARPGARPQVRVNLPVAAAQTFLAPVLYGPQRQLAIGAVGAADNVLKAGYSWLQRAQGKPSADPSSGWFGSALDGYVNFAYQALGATPPSRMTQAEIQGDQNLRSGVLNAALMPVPGMGGLGALTAKTALGGVVRAGTSFALNEAASNFLDNKTSGNIVNTINDTFKLKLPGAVQVGVDDIPDAALKSFGPDAAASAAFGAALGVAVPVIGAGYRNFQNILRNTRAQRGVAAEQAERAKQEAMGLLQKDEDGGLGFTDQARQPPEPPAPVAPPAPPRTPAEEGLDAVRAMEERLGGGQRQIPTLKDVPAEEFARPIDPMRPLPYGGNPANNPWLDDQEYQDWLRRNASNALAPISQDVPAAQAFAPQTLQPPQQDVARGEGFADPWGIGPNPNSAVQQWLEQRPSPWPRESPGTTTQSGADMGAVYEAGQDRPWDYDPSLPESTALGKAVNELSDTELQAVISNPGIPVVDRVNQTIEARGAVDPGPAIDSQMVMAPAGRLAEDYIAGLMRTLGGMEPRQLRQLFDSPANAGLWRRAQALTGVEDIAQLSKADMLDTIKAMAAEGQVPITNRLMGAQMMPTGDITPAPQVFQYKGGVNDAGEQLGNSLEGLERWDPKAEGIIQVWRDVNGEIGEPGKVYVVNGHNRLAAANRMGIPSMRVEFLDAPTAAEARLQGAVANVSDGKGTVFDAAKVAREMGITDPAQLKALGKPGASGFWKEGIALSRLPEDVFTAAVNEQIPLRRAVIIGESGVDPETMRSAYRYLVQQGPDNVKEATLREMLAMAGRSPAASSADQPDLLTGTEWGQTFNEGLLAKADLAGAVRLMLGKEKKLFGTVGRQAGQIGRVGQVDAAAAKDISGEASRALTIFDQLKYEAGPVGDLLNEGTQRILAGEAPAQVAQGIKNRLAAAIQEAMGKEAAPAVDVAQEDMFAAGRRQDSGPAAEPAAPQPIELTDEQRLAAEAQLLNEAIAGGEVRPPNAPIPTLPDPPQVRLDELDLNAPVTPGSKTAQAMADEARLAVEHARMDAAMAEMQEKAAKDAMDYELLTFEEKKELGMTAALDEAITPEVLPPGGMPGESRTPIADALGESLRALAESDARMFRAIGGLLGDMRRVADEMAGEGGGRPTGTPGRQALPEAPAATPPIEIPAAAGRKITARTSEGRIRGAADALASWTKAPGKDAMPIEKALDLVRAKGAILDPDAIPGLNVDAARNERGMGMTTPTTEAVAAAYRQFYGMPEPAPRAAAPTLAPAPVVPRPLRVVQPAAQPELLLPQDLQRSTPRYGRSTIAFQSDLDRAAYVLANDAAKPSKAADKFRQVVKEAGLDIAEVVAHGKRVKAALKAAGAGSQGEIQLPPQPWRGGGPIISPSLIDELSDPAMAASINELFGPDAYLTTPQRKERIASLLGNKKAEGVWTLGDEGAANQLERDILGFVLRMTGTRNVDIDIADSILVRSDGDGYGRVGAPEVDPVNGVSVDPLYDDADAIILLARYGQYLQKKLPQELAEVAVHEAIHFLQLRKLTHDQLEILTRDDAIAWYRSEAAKSGWRGSDGTPGGDLKNIELMAWGTQRWLAAELLRDMAALYRHRGKGEAAALIDELRESSLAEYSPPPTRLQEALKPLIPVWERIKNYLLGVGFKLNSELTDQQIDALAGLTGDLMGAGRTRIAKAIDPRPDPNEPPQAVKEILEAAYTGQIAKQMYLKPGRMGPAALAKYDRRWQQLGVSWGADGNAQRAAAPPPTKADITRTQQQIDAIDQQMAEIRAKAAQEGC